MPTEVVSRARKTVKRLIDNRLVYFHVARGPRSVVLTFDDGPHPELTPQILDLLDEYNARAVFFPIGELAEKEPDLLREVHRRGHCIGNHTFSHLNDGVYTIGQYFAEIRRCQELIRKIAGVKTRLFRPPRGEVNFKSVTATLWSQHCMVHWSLEGGEWGKRKMASSKAIANFVLKTIRPRDIVLFHDDNEKTIQVLKWFLPIAMERRFDLRFNSFMC